jgi:hypothetical protein
VQLVPSQRPNTRRSRAHAHTTIAQRQSPSLHFFFATPLRSAQATARHKAADGSRLTKTLNASHLSANALPHTRRQTRSHSACDSRPAYRAELLQTVKFVHALGLFDRDSSAPLHASITGRKLTAALFSVTHSTRDRAIQNSPFVFRLQRDAMLSSRIKRGLLHFVFIYNIDKKTLTNCVSAFHFSPVTRSSSPVRTRARTPCRCRARGRRPADVNFSLRHSSQSLVRPARNSQGKLRARFWPGKHAFLTTNFVSD